MAEVIRDFVISTDSTAGLPEDIVKEFGIVIQPIKYMIGDETYDYFNPIDPHIYYERMRAGESTGTAASNPEAIRESFEEILKSGRDILHISFSSGLSCSHNNASVVARELLEEYPEAKIEVIDSLSACLGQGLLVYLTCRQKAEGRTLSETADWTRENIHHLCHQFTVESLEYLHRGGRVSKAVMIVGTLLNIKPVLHVDDEGHLTPMSNVRGRKKSLIALVDNMEAQMGSYLDKNETIMIGHADCIEDAQFVGKLVTERFGITHIIYQYTSPTIGAHSGPGTVALFHLGEHR